MASAAVRPFEAIDSILKADLQAPRKQRHTTQRIYTRIRQECTQQPIGRSTVGEYVLARKPLLGLLRRGAFIPQSYEWGGEGQVDAIISIKDRSCSRLFDVICLAVRLTIIS